MTVYRTTTSYCHIIRVETKGKVEREGKREMFLKAMGKVDGRE